MKSDVGFNSQKNVTHSTIKVLHHSTSQKCVTAFPCSLSGRPTQMNTKISCNSLQWFTLAKLKGTIWTKISEKLKPNIYKLSIKKVQSQFACFNFLLISFQLNLSRLIKDHQTDISFSRIFTFPLQETRIKVFFSFFYICNCN